MQGQLDCTERPWTSENVLDHNIYFHYNFKQECTSSRILFRLSHNREQERISYDITSPDYQEPYDITAEPGRDRVDIFPKAHYDKSDPRAQNSAARIPKPHHLHVDVQRHRLEEERDTYLPKHSTREAANVHANLLNEARLFLAPETKKTGVGTSIKKPDGGWNSAANMMMLQFAEGGHPIFRGTSPLSRGVLKRKGGGQLSINYNAEPRNADWLRTKMVHTNKSAIKTRTSSGRSCP